MKLLFGAWSIFCAGYISAIIIDFAGWGDFNHKLDLGNFGNACVLIWVFGVGVYFMIREQ